MGDTIGDQDNDMRRRYKKITQADLIGKTAGRWTRKEHVRFIEGKLTFLSEGYLLVLLS